MKSLTIKQDINLVLKKSKSTLSITSKILSGKTSLTSEVIEDWITEIWSWADENNIPDLVGTENKAWNSGGYWEGLPRNKKELLNLTYLNLMSNQLTKLPKEIGNLTNLTNLELQDNQLTELPKEIGNLTNLKDLSLWGNQLIELPKEIGNLTNLTELNLGSNELAEVPKEIGNFTNLTNLGLEDNQLIELPYEIFMLPNLKELYIDDNPDLILSEYQYFYLVCKFYYDGYYKNSLSSENSLSVISLDIANYDVSEIPSILCNFINLKELDCWYNNLTELPNKIGNLQKLEILKLGVNNLTKLPESIVNLTNLKFLQLHGNPLILSNKQIIWLDRLRQNGCIVSIDNSEKINNQTKLFDIKDGQFFYAK